MGNAIVPYSQIVAKVAPAPKPSLQTQFSVARDIVDHIFHSMDPLEGYTYMTRENFAKCLAPTIGDEKSLVKISASDCVFVTEVTDNKLVLYWGHQITRMSMWYTSKMGTHSTLADIQRALEYLKSQKPYREELPGEHYDYFSIVNIPDEMYGQELLALTDCSLEEHEELRKESEKNPIPTRVHLYDPKMDLYVYDSVVDGSEFGFENVRVKFKDRYSTCDCSFEGAYHRLKDFDCAFTRFVKRFNLQFIEPDL